MESFVVRLLYAYCKFYYNLIPQSFSKGILL